jgi:hypothetical protein
MPGVLSVTSVYRPITHAGSVQTQGDAVVNADDVRAAGQDGSSFLIGALSDSALDIQASQSTGDLPSVVDQYLEFPASDEGRAMLEIIHDVAPGASLAHHSAFLDELSFANGIRELAEAGSRIVVDDVYNYSEPFFQDGIIAQAVNDVVTQDDVIYVSAAGNQADRSYEAVFRDDGSAFHDFDPTAGTDTLQQITVPAAPAYGYYPMKLVLQWNQPFHSENQGVTSDYDVFVYDAAGTTLISKSITDNINCQEPLEVVKWRAENTSPTS